MTWPLEVAKTATPGGVIEEDVGSLFGAMSNRCIEGPASFNLGRDSLDRAQTRNRERRSTSDEASGGKEKKKAERRTRDICRRRLGVQYSAQSQTLSQKIGRTF